MPAGTVFRLLQRTTTFRRYRKTMRQRMQHEPVHGLLPALLTLPMLPLDGLDTADTASAGMAPLFAQSPYVGLRGAPGSGRTLLLLQTVQHWLGSSRDEVLCYVPLARLDVLNMPPRAVLAGELHATGFGSPLTHATRTQPDYPWVLLLDEWEHLPAERRADWHAFCESLPALFPDGRVALTLPLDAPDVQGFQMVDLPLPDELCLRRWLAHLLPNHDVAPLLAALQPGAALAALRWRLCDLALLCLRYPEAGLPDTLGQLYEWAEARVLNHQHGNAAAVVSTGNGLHVPNATVSFQPVQPELPDSLFGVGLETLRCYRLARDLAALDIELTLTRLNQLEQTTRSETALLLVHLLPDPTPIYEFCWETGQVEDLLILVHGLCARPAQARGWVVPALETLLKLADRQSYQTLLPQLEMTLSVLLAADTTINAVQATRLLTRLAPLLGAPWLRALLVDIQQTADLRWAASDALLACALDSVVAALAAAELPDPLAQAAACSVLALHSAETRQLLADPARAAWLEALHSDAVEEPRRVRVASRLLADYETPAPLRLQALALLPEAARDAEQPGTTNVLARACADSEADVRHAAFATLQQQPPRQVLHVLSTILLDPTSAAAARYDSLERVAAISENEATALLARAALAWHLPLAARLRALVLLAPRPGGTVLLRRLLRVTTTHAGVRAAAAYLLRDRQDYSALGELCQLATRDEPLLLRQAAVDVLASMAVQARVRSEYTAPPVIEAICASLHFVLQQVMCDTALLLSTARALGQIGSPASIPFLARLLDLDLQPRLRTAWLKAVPALAQQPPEEWASLELPDDLRVALLTLLSAGETEADRPGSLDELVTHQVAALHRAAAEVLAGIAVQSDESTQRDVRAIFLTAIEQMVPGETTRVLLAALLRLDRAPGLEALGHLLSQPRLDPALRWLVVEQLASSPDTAPLLLRHLEQGVLDTFTRGKLAYSLGQHGVLTALPVLRQLAEQRENDDYLRLQAILGLGLLADPAVELTLLHIVADVTTSPALRGAAAEALPAQLRPEMRSWLYELLRRERQPPELLAGVLRALGRANDQEALGLVLRYVQHDSPSVATAALSVLGMLGDRSVLPMLVRVAQSTHVEQRVRLHAVTVLLDLGGSEYLSLLRGYLDCGVLTLQINAFDALLAHRADDPRVRTLVNDKSAALALRLWALEALPMRETEHALLIALLEDGSELMQLRSRAAALLAHAPAAVPALAACAQDASNPSRLRRACIAALHSQAAHEGSLVGPAAVALSQLDQVDMPATESQDRAVRALCGLVAGVPLPASDGNTAV